MNNRKTLQDKIASNNEAIASLTRGVLAAIQVLTDDSARANAALKAMSDTAEAVALSHATMTTNLESGIPDVDQYWNEEIGLGNVNALLAPHHKVKKKLAEPPADGAVITQE
jgi:hypothetical protein